MDEYQLKLTQNSNVRHALLAQNKLLKEKLAAEWATVERHHKWARACQDQVTDQHAVLTAGYPYTIYRYTYDLGTNMQY